MNYRHFLSLFFFVLSMMGKLCGQRPPIFFQQLSVADGLDDGHIQMIGQDKFGFLWFGSAGALSRYDSRQMRTYAYHAGEPHSPLSGMVFGIASDSSGRLFFGFENGMAEFDFAKNQFHEVEKLRGVPIYRIFFVENDAFYMATERGLARYDHLNGQADFFWEKDSLLACPMTNMAFHGRKLYICTPNGLLIYDLKSQKASKTNLEIANNRQVVSVCMDNENRLWMTGIGLPKIARLSADLSSFEVYDPFLPNLEQTISNSLFLARDQKGRIWITTRHAGLLEYLPETNSLQCHSFEKNKPWTPASNFYMSIFCDRDGRFWAGSSTGAIHFHPDKSLFEIIYPFDKDLSVRNREWGRAAAEDREKMLWMATADGLSRFDPLRRSYREWRNEEGKPPVLPLNSLRFVFCDSRNTIWVATSRGLAQFNRKTEKIEILTSEQGFLPLNCMAIAEDRAGNMWFSSVDGDGFYQYDPKTGVLRGIGEHPQLRRFAGLSGWSFLEDSRGRLWLGFNDQGLGMFDPASGQTYHWKSEGKNSIAGNLIYDITEDRTGKIWLATDHGLTEVDFEKNSFRSFHSDNGMSSNTICGIAADANNRLWVSTGKGLVMIDSSRQVFTHFSEKDGLPSLIFSQFPASQMPNGDIVMGTKTGFVRFNPANFRADKSALSFYVASFTAANVERPVGENWGQPHLEMELQPHENSCSFQLVALNFASPTQTWFAYQLDGFEREWHITKDPRAVYTNLPGGKYTFRYKASLVSNDFDHVPEKTIALHIQTIFYKTFWFWALLGSTVGGLLFFYFRNRKLERERLHDLQRKAQLLEKEKAVVQYESLRQQLNPHFLFNSLTSLSSLIVIDPRAAASFLDSLSKTYRYILKSSERETVPLGEELRFAESFTKLQKMRFGEGLQVEVRLDEELHHRKIVPVTLQNLLENAIKHNIIDEESPLRVEVFAEDDCLVVRNNLQRKKVVETSNQRGLAHLQTFYGYLSERKIEYGESGDGLFFSIRVPLL